MFTLFLRAMFLYIMMILVMRVLGKRQLGEFQPYELALTILLAEIIADPVGDVSMPLVHGLLPVAAVMVVHGAISVLCMKSDKFRAVVSGKPTLVISQGKINRRELDRLCLSLSDLLEGLRGAGCLDPAQVGTAIVEANGAISAFPDSASRPAATAELQLSPGYEGMPLPLIMDGRLQMHNLQQTGRSEKWLKSQLSRHGAQVEGVYLASLDTQGRMFLQRKDGVLIRFAALQPGEVNW